MDPVQLTNQDKLALLRQAAIMAAADTGQNQQPQQAFQKDINQDLLVLLLINPALAAIVPDLLEDQEDTDLIHQEDLLVEDHQVQVDLAGGHFLRSIVLGQNHRLVSMLLQNRAKKMQQENSKTSKILKPIKNQKSIAHLTPAINKGSAMKTMKAGAHAKAAAIGGCHLQPKNSLFVQNL